MTYNLRLRISVFLTAFGLLIGLYTYRLIRLQVVDAPKTASRTVGTFTYDTRVTAARGEILDRNGNVLISNRASYIGSRRVKIPNSSVSGFCRIASSTPRPRLPYP